MLFCCILGYTKITSILDYEVPVFWRVIALVFFCNRRYLRYNIISFQNYILTNIKEGSRNVGNNDCI